jgi:hypothetical protein
MFFLWLLSVSTNLDIDHGDPERLGNSQRSAIAQCFSFFVIVVVLVHSSDLNMHGSENLTQEVL